jgi:hypothetical protein
MDENEDNTAERSLPISPYNYCDYRCEKCDATDRCLVYSRELEDRDQGKSMLESVSDSIKEAMDMVQEFIREKDIDISDAMDDDENSFQRIHNMVKEIPVMKLGEEYLHKTMGFLKHYRERYLVPPLIEEAFADLSWYHTLLPVKMHRSLDSLYSFAQEEREWGEFALEDAFLTSLVVYKALSKSLAAVETLKKTLTDYRKTLTELEDILVRIRRDFKHEFPFEILMGLLKPGDTPKPSKTKEK